MTRSNRGNCSLEIFFTNQRSCCRFSGATDCLSGEIILAKTLLSSINEDLVALLLEVTNTLNVPIDGVVSDGQQSKRTSC
jgi:hypothetical protein